MYVLYVFLHLGITQGLKKKKSSNGILLSNPMVKIATTNVSLHVFLRIPQ